MGTFNCIKKKKTQKTQNKTRTEQNKQTKITVVLNFFLIIIFIFKFDKFFISKFLLEYYESQSYIDMSVDLE